MHLRDFWCIYFLLFIFILLTAVEFLNKQGVISYEDEDVRSDFSPWCSAKVLQMIEKFNEIQMHNLQNINTTGKFIVYDPYDSTGLGNRIPAYVSALIMAMILDVGFLVHWPADQLATNTEAEFMIMVAFKELFVPPIQVDTASVHNFLHIVTHENAVLFELEHVAETFLCHNITALYPEKRFHVLYGNKPFMDLLLQNPLYKEKVKKLGLTTHLIKTMGRCMLSPTKSINKMINNLYESQPHAHPKNIVGVHVRALSNRSVTPEGHKELWETVTTHYPPSRLGTPLSEAKYFYFLASDLNSTLNFVPPEVQPYILFQNGPEISRLSKEGIERAVADIFLLGNSLEIFGQTRTTFIRASQMIFDVPITRKRSRKYYTMSEWPCHKDWMNYKSFNFSCPHALQNMTC